MSVLNDTVEVVFRFTLSEARQGIELWDKIG